MLRRHRPTPTVDDPLLSADLTNWALAEITHLKGDSK